MIEIGYLKQILKYDRRKGVVFWRRRNPSMFKNGKKRSATPTESMVQVTSGNPTGFWARCFYTQWFRVLRVVDPHANGKIDAAEAALKAKLRSKHA